MNEEIIKKAVTINEIIPSKEFDSCWYNEFLKIANSCELENDVILQETYYRLCKTFDVPIPKPNFPKSRLIREGFL